MTMVSMKIDESELAEYKPNPYGYGLFISLNEDQVEALGLNGNPPQAGATVGLRAVAKVVRVEQNADADEDGDGVDVCLGLQITDLEVTPGGMSSGTASTLLYGNS